jgi:type II secretory pathway pseudopilin PulG
MKLSNKAGFTIIETMLFLGISGLLAMGLLTGVGTAINVQRYHDSVSSFQAFLQQQYSNVANVINDRNNNWTCVSGSQPTQPTNPGSGQIPGQSSCVILGEYITTDSAGDTLTVKQVIGSIPVSTDPSPSNDLAALQQYDIQVFPASSTTYQLDWGATIVSPSPGGSMTLSMLILQSPLSGTIQTFISPLNTVVGDNDIQTILKDSNQTTPTKMCINSNGLLTGSKMAVQINAYTTSPNGIIILGNNNGC